MWRSLSLSSSAIWICAWAFEHDIIYYTLRMKLDFISTAECTCSMLQFEVHHKNKIARIMWQWMPNKNWPIKVETLLHLHYSTHCLASSIVINSSFYECVWHCDTTLDSNSPIHLWHIVTLVLLWMKLYLPTVYRTYEWRIFNNCNCRMHGIKLKLIANYSRRGHLLNERT